MFRIIRRSQSTLLAGFFKRFVGKPKELTPIIIFDGSSLNEGWEDDWECTSDKVYGGPSVSDVSYEVPEDGTFSFLRFRGSLDMSSKKAKEMGVSGGFCALRGEIDSPDDLDGYKGVEIVYRSAVRTACTVNITLENRTEEDVYQTKMILSPTESWLKMHIPFDHLRLTLIGKDRLAQGSFEGSNIETFGFLIRNHRGPFCIDVHAVRILTEMDSRYVVQSTYERPNFHRLDKPRGFIIGNENNVRG